MRDSLRRAAILSSVLFIGLLTIPVAPASAGEVVDQSQPTSNYGFWFEAGVVRWQEFIPTLDNLTAVRVLIFRQGNPGDIIVNLGLRIDRRSQSLVTDGYEFYERLKRRAAESPGPCP